MLRVRAALFTLTAVVFSACNGGRLTLETNTKLSGVQGKLVGHCSAANQPVVLDTGYCVEFLRPTPSNDQPDQTCAAQSGIWTPGAACTQMLTMEGRCLLHSGPNTNIVYFINGADGPASCASGNGAWQYGNSF
jgi:hypothetical protein